jgi:hypothetical protein
MVGKEEVEQLMLQHLPACPLCKAQTGYEVSGIFRNYVRCRSCQAQWVSDDFVKGENLIMLKLWKSPRDGRGKRFRKQDHLVSFWQEMVQWENEEEFLSHVENEKKYGTKVGKIQRELYQLYAQTFKDLSEEDLAINEQRRNEIINKVREDHQLSEYFSDKVKSTQETPGVWASTLVLMADERGIDPLYRYLKEEKIKRDSQKIYTLSTDGRIIAVHSLGLFEKVTKNGRAIDPLIWVLKNDETIRVRCEAAVTLGELKGYPESVYALIEALNDVEMEAIPSRRGFSGISFIPGFYCVQRSAIEALKNLEDERGLEAINKPLKSPHF